MPPKVHKTTTSKIDHKVGEASPKHDQSKTHSGIAKIPTKPSKHAEKGEGSGRTVKKNSLSLTINPHEKPSKRNSKIGDFPRRKSGSHSKTDSGPDVLSSPATDPFLGLDPNFEPEPLIQAPTTMKVKGKRAFRRYIRESGIKLAVVRAIVSLYEEPNKPNDALGYICKQMGAGIPTSEDVIMLQAKIDDLRTRIEEKEAHNEAMRAKIQSRTVVPTAETDAFPEFQTLFDTFIMPSVSAYGLKATPGEEVTGEWEEEEEAVAAEDEVSNENESVESDENSIEEL